MNGKIKASRKNSQTKLRFQNQILDLLRMVYPAMKPKAKKIVLTTVQILQPVNGTGSIPNQMFSSSSFLLACLNKFRRPVLGFIFHWTQQKKGRRKHFQTCDGMQRFVSGDLFIIEKKHQLVIMGPIVKDHIE